MFFEANELNRGLLDFIDRTPNSFFAVANAAALLKENGFVSLREAEDWELTPGQGYYVTRNGSSLIAFRTPELACGGFQIVACHGDSPALKLKPGPELSVEGKYLRLNVEGYGGMICSSWFDRPLSLAGRVVVRTDGGVQSRLVNLDRDLLVIPNLAIHMDRSVNDGYKYNIQRDLLPLLACGGETGALAGLIAANANVAPEDVLDTELFLYNRQKGTILGLQNELICSGRLDDLQCAYAALMGFLRCPAFAADRAAVYCLFDNEEVGSGTKQGAASGFLKDTLRRLSGGGEGQYLRALAGSMMVSADNAQGLHPNHTEKADPVNRPVLNGGVVIKYSGNQKYTTDAVSGALFRLVCEKAGVPVQVYTNRSDIAGGSTLGNISTTQVALKCVDVGLAQLAMHSAYETAGAADTAGLAEACRMFFSAAIRETEDGAYRLQLP